MSLEEAKMKLLRETTKNNSHSEYDLSVGYDGVEDAVGYSTWDEEEGVRSDGLLVARSP